MFKIENKADSQKAVIYLYGTIGYDWWKDDDRRTAEGFSETLDELAGKDIEVRIDSCGGDVYEAFGIASALQRYEGNIEVYVDGVAASAASYIAEMGDKIFIAQYAQMMIHNASTNAWGNKNDLALMIERLDSVDKSIAGIIASRSSMELDDVLTAMDSETWYTAQEAVDAGLADEIIEVEQRVSACIDHELMAKYKHAPKDLIEDTTEDNLEDEASSVDSDEETEDIEIIDTAEDEVSPQVEAKSHAVDKVSVEDERHALFNGHVIRL